MTDHIDTDSGAYLEVQNLVKYFGNDRAVDDISFCRPQRGIPDPVGAIGVWQNHDPDECCRASQH